jgi:Fe-S oxidoreductase
MLKTVHLIAFVLCVIYALYLFVHVVRSRVAFILLGKKTPMERNWSERLHAVLVQVFGQRKLFKDKKSGIMHFLLFYGFFIIQLGLIELVLKGFRTGYEFPLGAAHKYFSLMQEWATFLMLAAILYGAYRRYGEKLQRLQWKRDWKAAFVYIALTVLTMSIFLALGFENIMLQKQPEWAFAPFSGFVTFLFSGIGTDACAALFYLFWWIHMLTVLSFMVFVPQSKQAHELFAIFNVFFQKTGPAGRLRKIDFEDESAETFGASKIEDFTRQQLLNLYSCVECGRCTNMCPASGTGKLLSPMHLMTKLRDHLTEKGAAITSRTPWMPAFFAPGTGYAEVSAGSASLSANLIGDVISEDELWACTTCRNCEDQCPVSNEHVGIIMDMRRYLVMTKGDVPPEAARFLQNIERQSNPWGLSRNERIQWREGLEDIVKTVSENPDFEVLFWVGSMGSYDLRSRKIARSFARLLHAAGVNFAILGNEEKSSGDTVRRIGNEYLFQELCMENIQTFRKYGVKKIVTTDPHAFNTFRNEYPEFGLEAEVWHHTEFLWQLLQEGRLRPAKEVREKIVYHDSCYMGRYNGLYDKPREILRAIPGVQLLEMERNRENALCCGAGGGRMWMEEREGTRINLSRTAMALKVSPTVIGSNCPYCLTMLTDGAKAMEADQDVETLDIAEILERAVV